MGYINLPKRALFIFLMIPGIFLPWIIGHNTRNTIAITVSWFFSIFPWNYEKKMNYLVLYKQFQNKSRKSSFLPKYQQEIVRISALCKGQIISKRFFSGRGFAQKTNENTSHISKNEFIRSFFGRILGLTICFRN